jgi:hypothetical protein
MTKSFGCSNVGRGTPFQGGTARRKTGCLQTKGAIHAENTDRAAQGDKRYVRRSTSGQFTEKQVNVGRSLSADRRSKSKTVAKKGDGDRGDRRSR